MQLEPIVRRTYDNGLVLVSERTPWSQRVAVNIGIKVGSVDELPSEEGAAHFLEHLMWKRKTKKETRKRGLIQDRHGILSNAATDFGLTEFTIEAPKDKLSVAFSTAMADLGTFEFDPSEFSSEREVVLTEIKRRIEDHAIFGYYRLHEKLFGGTLLARPIEGTYDPVASLSQDRILDFKRKWYVPNNMVVSVVGNFDQHELEEIIARTLGTLKRGVVNKREIILPECKPSINQFEREGLELVHLNIGFNPGHLTFDEKEYLSQAIGVLSDGEGAILRQEFREKEGLVYAIGASSTTPIPHTTFIHIGLECEPHKLRRVEEKMYLVLEKMKQGRFSRRRFEDAKTVFKTSILERFFEDLSCKAEILTARVLSDDRRDYRGLIQRIDELSYERTQEHARRFFSQPYVTVKLVPA